MGFLPNAYLTTYNMACALTWGVICYEACLALDPNNLLASLATIFDLRLAGPLLTGHSLSTLLFYVQYAAILEVVHSATGLVRSPVFVTFLQVLSRVGVLGMALLSSPGSAARSHYGAGLMVLAWSMVEVPRYLFYVAAILTGDATKGTPYPLFFLRYSLFAVLYPMGISGECLTFYNLLTDDGFVAKYGVYVYWGIVCVLAVYIPGGPFMYFNMVGNRKSAMKKRFMKPRPPPKGLLFPVTNKDKNERSTSTVGKNVLAAAVRPVDDSLANKILKCKNWRFGYNKLFCKMVEAQCGSPKDALTVAEAGLAYMHENFEFVNDDGSSVSFKEAMGAKNKTKFKTGYVAGDAKMEAKTRLEVPYKGGVLFGDELKEQVGKWVEYGTIEQSAGDAICNCVDNKKWLDLSDKYFVLLGAGSAMGPYEALLALGANIVAIDLDRGGIWNRLINLARNSPGSVTFPIKGDLEQNQFASDEDLYEKCGSNLFTETPLIKDWLLNLYPKEQFVVGSYAYLDGALHVQVSLAMDAICAELSQKRKSTLAYLCTPTDAHLVPEECNKAAELEYNRLTLGKVFEVFWQVVSRGKFLVKNARKPVNGFYYVDGISVAQGPNYALAKRIQHWRAIVARERHGCTVSSNIAPSTSTLSVVSNRTFAWAYEGMPYFKPYEISHPATSKAVMLAILANDIRNAKSVANPKVKLDNPNQLFSSGSFHGGVWRSAYTVDSIGEVSVFIYFAKCALPMVGPLLGVGVGLWFKLVKGV